jgi:N-acylneuraminate cytidylyltransferase/CMP-N,N'-diacetyllegionaminic acid synthase
MPSLGIIPIRFQSSRFPNKSFALLDGKPLIDWTIDIAKLSNLDEIIVVTSNKEIRTYCDDRHVAVVVRPIGLESDSCHVLHTINWLNESAMNSSFDVQVLLQITNPLRTVNDVNSCLDYLQTPNINSACTVTDVGEFHPSRMFKRLIANGIEPLKGFKHWANTQDLEKIWLRDGSVYAWKTKSFLKFGDTLLPPLSVGHEIPNIRSCRIDTPDDLERAIALHRAKSLDS